MHDHYKSDKNFVSKGHCVINAFGHASKKREGKLFIIVIKWSQENNTEVFFYTIFNTEDVKKTEIEKRATERTIRKYFFCTIFNIENVKKTVKLIKGLHNANAAKWGPTPCVDNRR